MIKKASKEIGRRNCKSTFDKRNESNNFSSLLIWPTVTKGRSPSNNRARLEKAFADKREEVRFGALTWQPPIVEGGSSASRILLLPLAQSFGYHVEIHQSRQAHTLGGYAGEQGRAPNMSKEEI